MSSSTSPTDWFHHFYNQAAAAASTATLFDQSSDATVVSTIATTSTNTITTTSAGAGAGAGSGSGATTNLTHNYSLGQMGQAGSDHFLSALSPSGTTVSGRSGQEGRVSRPARRRSRASRKNPTTLLNTDTTNFRAMVQRYTGGGANMAYPPSLESASLGGGGFQGQMGNFSHLQHGSTTAGVDFRTSQLHQQLLMQQHGFTSTANTSDGSGIGHVDPRATLDQGSSHDQLYSSSSMGDENKRGGFMF